MGACTSSSKIDQPEIDNKNNTPNNSTNDTNHEDNSKRQNALNTNNVGRVSKFVGDLPMPEILEMSYENTQSRIQRSINALSIQQDHSFSVQTTTQSHVRTATPLQGNARQQERNKGGELIIKRNNKIDTEQSKQVPQRIVINNCNRVSRSVIQHKNSYI